MDHRPAGLPRSQLIAIALILILGLGFRCYGLDHKVYWHDEVFTSLRAAGYTGEDVASQLLEQSSGQPLGQAVTAADLQQFQRLSPDKTWADTWASLKTHPEHPPLFFLLTRGWMGLMGSSIAATRGLSALFSIALFPLVAWFCSGLTRRRQTAAVAIPPEACVAIALLAVSPVQILYAQEARQYSLWACEIILACGLLLRAVQHPRSWRLWLGYGLAIALGLYTTLLMGLVIFAHGVFLLGHGLWDRGWGLGAGRNPPNPPLPSASSGTGKGRLPVPELAEGEGDRGGFGFLSWLSAIGLAVMLFSPWLLVAFQASQKLNSVTAWTKVSLPLDILSKLWGLHLAASFIDLGLPLDHAYSLMAPAAVLLIVSLSWRSLPQGPVRWFLLTLLVLPALLLILPDLIQGGQRSSVTRYFMPLVLMALVTVALAIARGFKSPQRASRLACQLLLVGLLIAGTASCYRSAIAPAWWNKSFNFVMPAMANYIAEAQQVQPTPVWIELGSNGLGNAIALSYRLPAETPFYFFKLPELPPQPQSSLLIPYASGELIEAVQQTYGQPLEAVTEPGVYELWVLAMES